MTKPLQSLRDELVRRDYAATTIRSYIQHVVFTLPHGLLPLAYRNATRLYTWLFQASAATLREVAADPRHLGAEIGILRS